MKDWFDGAGKDECRSENLRVASEIRGLWDKASGMLNCRWCELAGSSASLSITALGEKVCPSDFVGVDVDVERIHRLKKEYPKSVWIEGDIYSAVSRLRRLRIGILNIDGYGNAGREGPSLRATIPLISQSLKERGTFLLILNRSLDGVRRQGQKPSDALRNQARTICESLGSLPIRPKEEDLLPIGLESIVDSPTFSGKIGAFHVYRGKRQRMANARIIF